MLAEYPIALDAAACGTSTLVADHYLGLDHPDPDRRDALAFDSWAHLVPAGGAVWLNPPYVPVAVMSAFLHRAVATAADGVPVVGLVPASTGARWWWDHVVDAGADVEFLRGRLSFGGPHAAPGTAHTAPWASALVRWPAGSPA